MTSVVKEKDKRPFSLIDFFKFYSRDFTYNTSVVSIRAGLLTKESKGWQSEVRDWVLETSLVTDSLSRPT